MFYSAYHCTIPPVKLIRCQNLLRKSEYLNSLDVRVAMIAGLVVGVIPLCSNDVIVIETENVVNTDI